MTQRVLLIPLVLALVIAAGGTTSAEGPEESGATFPESWVGAYGGDLVIRSPGAASKTVAAEMRVEATESADRFRWRLRYGEQAWREYRLVVVDRATGSFVLDEQNSIRIPAVLLDDELISVFSVMGNRISVRYRKDGDTVLLDMLSTTAEPAGKTGGEGGVPTVDTFRVQNRQQARLEKKAP